MWMNVGVLDPTRPLFRCYQHSIPGQQAANSFPSLVTRSFLGESGEGPLFFRQAFQLFRLVSVFFQGVC